MKLKQILLLGSCALLMSACQSGNCRSQPENQKKIDAQPEPALQSKTVMDRVRVFKYDGSLQCNQGKSVSVQDMQKELKGLQVFKAENKSDGLMRTMVCGTPTGRANVYEIQKTDLAEAKKRGFQEWTFD